MNTVIDFCEKIYSEKKNITEVWFQSTIEMGFVLWSVIVKVDEQAKKIDYINQTPIIKKRNSEQVYVDNSNSIDFNLMVDTLDLETDESQVIKNPGYCFEIIGDKSEIEQIVKETNRYSEGMGQVQLDKVITSKTNTTESYISKYRYRIIPTKWNYKR